MKFNAIVCPALRRARLRRVLTVAMGVLSSALQVDQQAMAQCDIDWTPGLPVQGAFLGVNGAVTWDPDGAGLEGESLVIAGNFTQVGDQPFARVARFDGTTWHSIGNGLSNKVDEIVIFEGALVTASSTGQASSERSRVHRWNGSNWEPLGEEFNRSVLALAVHAGQLYAAGKFTAIGETSAARVAVWDGTAWQPLGSGIGSETVYALTSFNGLLVAGGYFSVAGGRNAASWNGTTWQSMGAGLNQHGNVSSLAVFDGQLIAGGGFSTAQGAAANKVARWSGTAWQSMGSPQFYDCYSLWTHAGSLYAGGAGFSSGVLRWTGSTWSNIGNFGGGWVNAMTTFNNELIVCGDFNGSFDYGLPGFLGLLGLAKWNGTQVVPLVQGVALDGPVTDLEIVGGILYATGSFQFAGGTFVSRIARWDTTSWQPLSQGLQQPDDPTPYPSILVEYQNEVVVSGNFTYAGEYSSEYIAAWNGSDWHPFGNGLDAQALALLVYDGDLVAAGPFESADLEYVGGIAVWNGLNWSSMGTGVSGSPQCLAEYNGELILGGAFFSVDGVSANMVARWNGSDWRAFPVQFGAGSETSVVNAMTVFEGDLIVAGDFTIPGHFNSSTIARWDGASWHEMEDGFYAFAPEIYSFTLIGSNLYALGSFRMEGGAFASLARWNGTKWVAVPAAGAGFLLCLETFGDEFFFGAGANAINGVYSPYFVHGVAQFPSCAPGDSDCSGAVDLNDLPGFVATLLATGVSTDCEQSMADLNDDSRMDGEDIGVFTECLTMGNCP